MQYYSYLIHFCPYYVDICNDDDFVLNYMKIVGIDGIHYLHYLHNGSEGIG